MATMVTPILNIKANYHTHTNYCDGKDSVEAITQEAIARGFTHLGYSSHSLYPLSSDWHIKTEEHNDYLKAISDTSAKYGDKLNILAGFEVDYIPGVALPDLAHYKDIFGTNSVDYIIGSVHYLPSISGLFAIDGASKELSWGLETRFKGNRKALVQEYFLEQENMLRYGNFTILGHPDLIRKHNSLLQLFSPSDSWYTDCLKSLTLAISHWGGLVEVNTGAVARAHLDHPYPAPELLSLLYEAKVPLVLSSDCHNKSQLDAAFTPAIEYIKGIGYKELHYLERTAQTLHILSYNI